MTSDIDDIQKELYIYGAGKGYGASMASEAHGMDFSPCCFDEIDLPL